MKGVDWEVSFFNSEVVVEQVTFPLVLSAQPYSKGLILEHLGAVFKESSHQPLSSFAQYLKGLHQRSQLGLNQTQFEVFLMQENALWVDLFEFSNVSSFFDDSLLEPSHHVVVLTTFLPEVSTEYLVDDTSPNDFPLILLRVDGRCHVQVLILESLTDLRHFFVLWGLLDRFVSGGSVHVGGHSWRHGDGTMAADVVISLDTYLESQLLLNAHLDILGSSRLRVHIVTF